MGKKNNSKKSNVIKKVKKTYSDIKLKNKAIVVKNSIFRQKEKSIISNEERTSHVDSNSPSELSQQSESYSYPTFNPECDDKEVNNENINKIQLVIIKKGKNKEQNTSLEEIKNIFKEKQYKKIKEYVFPYINIGKFNSLIYPKDIKIFRSLFFYCPICKKIFRNYSISYHIFQNHFSEIENYLSQNEIAYGCAMLLEKEYRKIKNSLENFAELSILFKSTKIKGFGFWTFRAEKIIEEIKRVKIEQIYFKMELSDVKKNLEKKLPLNKNKNKNRHYKEKNLELLEIKKEIKEIRNESI